MNKPVKITKAMILDDPFKYNPNRITRAMEIEIGAEMLAEAHKANRRHSNIKNTCGKSLRGMNSEQIGIENRERIVAIVDLLRVCTIAEIIPRVSMHKSAVTERLNQLFKAGKVNRRRKPKCGRVWEYSSIHLTAAERSAQLDDGFSPIPTAQTQQGRYAGENVGVSYAAGGEA